MGKINPVQFLRQAMQTLPFLCIICVVQWVEIELKDARVFI